MIHYITGMISLSKTGSFVFQDKTCTIVLITLQNKPQNHRLEETVLITAWNLTHSKEEELSRAVKHIWEDPWTQVVSKSQAARPQQEHHCIPAPTSFPKHLLMTRIRDRPCDSTQYQHFSTLHKPFTKAALLRVKTSPWFYWSQQSKNFN